MHWSHAILAQSSRFVGQVSIFARVLENIPELRSQQFMYFSPISCSNKGTKTVLQTRHDLPSARTLLRFKLDGFITGSRVQQATVSSTFFMRPPDSCYMVASIRHTIHSSCNWEFGHQSSGIWRHSNLIFFDWAVCLLRSERTLKHQKHGPLVSKKLSN